MNKSALLFKTLYRNATAPSQAGKGKKRISRSVGAILSISPLVIMIAVLMAFLASSLKSIADLSALLTSVLFATQMMVLFLSMASMFSTLYDAKDTPFLQSLPIKPTGVFFAKFALVYVNALKFSVVAFLPVSPAVKYAVFLLLSMPSATSTALFALVFGGDADFSSVCVLLSTLLSVISLPLMFLLINGVFGVAV